MNKSSIITINFHRISILILIIWSITLANCSSSKEVENEKPNEDEIYIFDEIPPEDSYTFDKEVSNKEMVYAIQIGAFSTQERADLFAEKSRINLNRKIAVNYNDEVSLYVVRLQELFNNKIEAERVRANLWQMEEYNDAWIIPIKQKEE